MHSSPLEPGRLDLHGAPRDQWRAMRDERPRSRTSLSDSVQTEDQSERTSDGRATHRE